MTNILNHILTSLFLRRKGQYSCYAEIAPNAEPRPARCQTFHCRKIETSEWQPSLTPFDVFLDVLELQPSSTSVNASTLWSCVTDRYISYSQCRKQEVKKRNSSTGAFEHDRESCVSSNLLTGS